MNKYVINESTLTSIGDAIRAKGNTTEEILVSNLATAISNLPTGGGGEEPEPIVLTGDCSGICSGQMASYYIENFGHTVSTNAITTTQRMFMYGTMTNIPFAINFNHKSYWSLSSMFFNCHNLKALPEMKGAYPQEIANLCDSCYSLRYLPEDFGADWNWTQLQTNAYAAVNNCLSNCYSLRKVPASFMKNLWGKQTSSYYMFYYNGLMKDYALDEARDIPVQPVTLPTQCFSNFMTGCWRVKSITFETNEDGTPKTANWKNQNINWANSSNPMGYGNYANYFTDYNSGITADKRVTDDASYQALKNDPDWFTTNQAYSRYNHDSAVETINSLPDTSAYLAANGGTNTIKFAGKNGSATDGGAINTLTEAEIAVAAAKGWTVTFV